MTKPIRKPSKKTDTILGENLVNRHITRLLSFFGIGFVVGVIVAVILFYIGAWPTKLNIAGVEFDLPSHCACIPIPPLPSVTAIIPTPTPTVELVKLSMPTPTSTPDLNNSIRLLDEYFQLINDATTQADIEKSWNYLGPPAQCAYGCSPEPFLLYWWKYRIGYKIFSCKTYEANVEYSLYKRTDIIFGSPTEQKIYKFYLDFNSDYQLKITSFIEISNNESNCQLMVDKSNPSPEP